MVDLDLVWFGVIDVGMSRGISGGRRYLGGGFSCTAISWDDRRAPNLDAHIVVNVKKSLESVTFIT